MFMVDNELKQLVQCPRCREQIPLTRTYVNVNEHLACNIRYQGCPVAEAVIFPKPHQTREDSIFYATVVGEISNPEQCVRNRDCKAITQYNRLPSGRVEPGVFKKQLEDIPSGIRVLGLEFQAEAEF